MAIVLYDLAGKGDRRFSPTCWRVKLALAHKQLPFETVPVRFVDIRTIGDGRFRTVPVIDDNGHWLGDSAPIAACLERAYPDRPSLFDGPGGEALTSFVRHWTQVVLHAAIIRMVLTDIHATLADAEDQAYFRASREARFGQPLEAIVADRAARLPAFRAGLEPLRSLLGQQPFLGGERPRHADHVAMAAFLWARSVSGFVTVEPGDPVQAWLGRLEETYADLLASAGLHPL